MKYVSTRGQSEAVNFADAVAMGLAPDGGLYLPEQLPDLSDSIKEMEGMPYAELCYQFLRHFVGSSIEDATLKRIVDASYQSFDHDKIAPLKKLNDELYVLELFHGPTLAFKDFALQLLGNLYEEQIRRTGKPINVLGATSGDTGSAAIHGLLGKEGVNIFILYPSNGVSALQELQMTCTGADNVYAIGIDGSFDDAQRIVKETFGDNEFKNSCGLSAVNSINLARILAQCVYYLYAWYQLPADSREHVVFNVPTGNFGNILAGWFVQKMGLPVKGLKVATNQNDILYRLFTTGKYEVGKVLPSHAPSMDIQVSSNFERFLYYMEGCNAESVVTAMEAFKQFGVYLFEEFDSDTFSSSRMTDKEIPAKIKELHEKYDYIVDPHTACAFKDLDEGAVTVALSTAHPAKFPSTISEALGKEVTHPTLEKLKSCEPSKPRLSEDSPEGIKAFIKDICA